MRMLKFKTNINCTGCLSKVTPMLDKEKAINTWTVDLKSGDRVLTVDTKDIGELEIVKIVNSAGYKAEKI